MSSDVQAASQPKQNSKEKIKRKDKKNRKHLKRQQRSDDDKKDLQQTKPRKSKDTKIDRLAKTLQVGQKKKWVATSEENKFTKIMIKILLHKEPFYFKFVVIEKGTNIPEVRYRTTITLADVKKLNIEFHEAVTTMILQTRIVAPFERGTRQGDTIVWSELRDMEWQNEQLNPNCNVMTLEFDAKKFPPDLKSKLIESHPRFKKLLTKGTTSDAPSSAHSSLSKQTTADIEQHGALASKAEKSVSLSSSSATAGQNTRYQSPASTQHNENNKRDVANTLSFHKKGNRIRNNKRKQRGQFSPRKKQKTE